MKRFFITLLIFAGVLSPFSAYGDMVSPDNTTYHIYADAVDAGGVLSVGGVYSLEDTVGETGAATSTSGGVYEVRGGYQAMSSSSVSINFSDSTMDLGELSAASVKTASTVASITIDDSSGYTLSVGSIAWGDNVLDDVGGDHAVTAGVEEYGFAASGDDSQVVGDWAVTAGQLISASSTPVYDSLTTITFKASISAASTAGAYTQTIVLQASVNLE